MIALFFMISIISVVTSIMVIFTKNPIHSVFYLVLVFLNSAALFILLRVEFLAISFIIVYVGAIAILFLFIVMMLNIRLVELNEDKSPYAPVSFLTAIIFFYEIYLLIRSNLPVGIPMGFNPIYYMNFQKPYELLINSSNMEILGFHLYTLYFPFFWVASLILLVAMMGAIILTLHLQINVKSQEVFKQSSSFFSKSIILKI